MARAAAAVLLLLLAACGGPSYRDISVQMTSMALFDPARYAGIWYEVARYPVWYQEGCVDSRAIYAQAGPGTLLVRNICDRVGMVEEIGGTARVVGPGRLRLRLEGVPVAADYWVLWVDQDYRTAVVGTPSGRAAWILNRAPEISPDRLNAARDVLRFNGYDLSRLDVKTPEGGQ
jgi:apolipoprotein D and lipocalin family protein